MKKIVLNDIAKFCKQNSVSKKELIFLLHVYNKYTNNYIESSDISLNDISSLLKRINESLKKSNETSIVKNKIDVELSILDSINNLYIDNKKFDDEYLFELYYKSCLLSFEENLEIEKPDILLEKKLNLSVKKYEVNNDKNR